LEISLLKQKSSKLYDFVIIVVKLRMFFIFDLQFLSPTPHVLSYKLACVIVILHKYKH